MEFGLFRGMIAAWERPAVARFNVMFDVQMDEGKIHLPRRAS